MDNFSVRSERNFHNLAAKPKRMHLLDKPNGYASAMVKSSLSHQIRFTVQKLGEDSCEPSSWKLFADGTCIADGSGDLPASVSARAPRCFWTCVVMPSRLPSCTSGARGSTSC